MIQFGKRAGDATNVAAEQLSRVGAHEQLQEMLADIEHAQEKLAAGTYGECDECGVRSATRGSRRCRGRPSASSVAVRTSSGAEADPVPASSA